MMFYMPTKVYQEAYSIKNHLAEVAGNYKKALLITGKLSSRVNGSLEDVQDALKRQNVAFTVFDKVEENPSVETVMKATKLGLQEQADFVIGIGGGSPLDAAKAVAVMMANPEKDWDYLFTNDAHVKALPVVAVPTTCGTGSEVTGVAVLTRHDLSTKVSMSHRIFPVLALIDPRYLRKAPMELVRNTAMDALGHLIESGLSAKADAYSKMLVEEGIRTWCLSKDVLTGKRELDVEDWGNLMRASALGGMAIAQTGTTVPHALSYRLTYGQNVAHGNAIGCFQAGYVKAAPEAQQQWILGLCNLENPEKLQAMYETICKKPKLDEALMEDIVAELKNNAPKLESCSFPVDEAVLRDIVNFAK